VLKELEKKKKEAIWRAADDPELESRTLKPFHADYSEWIPQLSTSEMLCSGRSPEAGHKDFRSNTNMLLWVWKFRSRNPLREGLWEMMQKRTRNVALIALSLTGLLVAALAGLSEHVRWLEFMCASFSDGCRETHSVYRISTAHLVWESGFMRFWQSSSTLLGLAGLGGWCPRRVEVALVWIMVSTNMFCIYCLVNALVVIMLAPLAVEGIGFGRLFLWLFRFFWCRCG